MPTNISSFRRTNQENQEILYETLFDKKSKDNKSILLSKDTTFTKAELPQINISVINLDPLKLDTNISGGVNNAEDLIGKTSTIVYVNNPPEYKAEVC